MNFIHKQISKLNCSFMQLNSRHDISDQVPNDKEGNSNGRNEELSRS